MKRSIPVCLTAAVLAVLAGCEQPVPDPQVGIALAVRRPLEGKENPFSGLQNGDAFVALIAEGPGLQSDVYQSVQPLEYGGRVRLDCDVATKTCKGVPFGKLRQIRVELWSKDPATGQPAPPVLARGRTVPVDFELTSSPKTVFPYLTKIAQFAGAYDDVGNRAAMPGRGGTAAATLPSGEALFFGGGQVKPDAKNPYDPTSYSQFLDDVLVYQPDKRTLVSISDSGPEYRLKTPRAFHSVAVGQNYVAVVGGYVMVDGKPVPTNTVEYFDGQLKSHVDKPMKFARAGATVMQMFPGSDYFLILGGKGDTPCTNNAECAGNSWEVWHPIDGAVGFGLMNEARWNHAGVRISNGPNGGFALLIGGENEDKVLNTFEVIQFTTQGPAVSQKGATSPCTCSGTSDSCQSDGECNGSKCLPPAGQNLLCSFNWQPLTVEMPVARTMPGGALVDVPGKGQGVTGYRYVYMVGGFQDKEHTKPLARIDAFNIDKGDWASGVGGFQLKEARAAPMVAVVPAGPTPGQLLIAGGSVSDTVHLSSAEYVYGPATAEGPKISVVQVDSPMPGGIRTAGAAVPLSTGHVLVGGGVGTGPKGLEPQGDLLLWMPF